MVICVSLCNCYESSRFIGRLRDPEVITMTYLPVTTIPLAVNSPATQRILGAVAMFNCRQGMCLRHILGTYVGLITLFA